MEKEHSLVGIIDFKSPTKQTRQSNGEGIGHYTAICHRKSNTWVRYDDCKESETKLKDKHIVCPHIILYSV